MAWRYIVSMNHRLLVAVRPVLRMREPKAVGVLRLANSGSKVREFRMSESEVDPTEYEAGFAVEDMSASLVAM
jgi:hypothetical protein